MGKLINTTLIAFVMIALSCTSQKKSEIQLKNGNIVLTRIDMNENELKTILYRGSYTNKLPLSYVYVNHARLLDGFQALLEYKDDKVILLQPYQYFKHVGDSNSIIIRTINDSTFYSIFFSKIDTHYVKVQNEQ